MIKTIENFSRSSKMYNTLSGSKTESPEFMRCIKKTYDPSDISPSDPNLKNSY